MSPKQKSFLRKWIRKVPFLRRWDDRISFSRSFQVEKALLRGNHQNANLHPSILHFTCNKSASQHVLSVLARCTDSIGMKHANLNGYIFNTSLPFMDKMSPQELREHDHVFKTRGYLYSAFGGMIDGIPDFEEYKVILMLRDPRDVLVSNYYSRAYSHMLPMEGSARREEFMQNRKKALETSLDDYVRERSSWVKGVYERYYSLLIKRYSPACYYYTTYEAMVADYSKWLRDLIVYTELDVPASLVDTLVDENERSRPVQEDVHRRRRLGRRGDYAKKLSSETVTWLNVELHEILSVFGYLDEGLPKINYTP